MPIRLTIIDKFGFVHKQIRVSVHVLSLLYVKSATKSSPSKEECSAVAQWRELRCGNADNDQPQPQFRNT